MTRIGRLSEQITLKTKGAGTSDGIGGESGGTVQTLAANLWASVDPVPAKLAVKYQGPENARFYQITTRAIPELDLNGSIFWIEWKGMKLTVHSVTDPFNRGIDLEILAFTV